MSVLVSSSHFVARALPMAEVDVDESGYITKHWFFRTGPNGCTAVSRS